MKKLILHIGYFKTGTTSLQNYLHANRDHLLKNGILYPQSGFVNDNGHVELVSSALRDLGRNIPVWLHKTEPHAHYWGALMQEIKDTECDTVILSNEHFCEFANSTQVFKLIHPYLKNFDVRVLCYLRRIDEYFLSWYNHIVKCGWCTLTIDTLYERYKQAENIHLYHGKTLDFYANQFGADKLITRLYNKNLLHGGDIVNDFCSIMGIDPGSAEKSTYKDNTRIDSKSLYLKALCNTGFEANTGFLEYNVHTNKSIERILEFMDKLPSADFDSDNIIRDLQSHITHIDTHYCSGYANLYNGPARDRNDFLNLLSTLDDDHTQKAILSLLGLLIKDNHNTHLHLADLQNRHNQLLKEMRTQNLLMSKLIKKLDT